ncbi:MAG TPA: thioredoxin domain-containing protein [Spirillospora sp.]
MSEQGRRAAQHARPTGERARAAARRRRRRLLVVVTGGVAAAALVVAVTVVAVVRDGAAGPLADGYDGPLAPATRLENGAVAMGRPGVAAPVLDVYEDFQCPACRAMEKRLGGTFKKLAAEGRLTVVYRPFQLFQQDPPMSNSRRAANAAACIPVDEWIPYHDRLFAEQPVEGDEGFTPAELIEWAADLGVTDPGFAACVRRNERIDLVGKASSAAGRAGVDATPYLALNGAKLGTDVLGSPEELEKAVEGAVPGTPPLPPPSGGPAGGAVSVSPGAPS